MWRLNAVKPLLKRALVQLGILFMTEAMLYVRGTFRAAQGPVQFGKMSPTHKLKLIGKKVKAWGNLENISNHEIQLMG